MPRTLAPIPAGSAIVNQNGSITDFFRLRWQSLIDGFLFSPSVASVSFDLKTAAIVTVAAYTTRASGLYRVSYFIRKTIADGVSSSLTVTLGWIEGGIGQSATFAALATDTTAAEQDASKTIRVDAETDITYAIAYASNTPAKMTYEGNVVVEQLV